MISSSWHTTDSDRWTTYHDNMPMISLRHGLAMSCKGFPQHINNYWSTQELSYMTNKTQK